MGSSFVAMKKILTCSLLLTAVLSISAQHVELTKENTFLTLGKDHVRLNAELTYKNNSGQTVSQMIFFPLCVRNDELKRDTFAIFDMTANAPITSYKKQPAGIFYMLNFQPNQQRKIRITCGDDHNGSMIKYLVMTNINFWGLPLDQGDYTLKYDNKMITIDSTSFKPDQQTTNDAGESLLIWKKTNWKPDKELEVYFKMVK